jgi:cytochrome c oxidase subunit II
MKPAARCRSPVSLLALAAPASARALPMDYLHTFGPAGDPATHLGWGLGIISVLVTVLIAVLLLLAVFRPRVPAEARALAVRRDGGGMSWIYIGVGLSIVVLIACAIWTVSTMVAVAMPARTALTVHVTAQQWWWDVRYQNDDPSQMFTTANEIHIPVGQPVRFELTSPDVIHSFWIPQLGGKTDVIPAQTNVMWLQADTPGRYRGQCTEYCGAQHAHMAMFVVADTPEDYAAWARAQRAPAAQPASDAMRRGEAEFVAHCSACHAVRGSGAGGIMGPDLTHLMSRKTIAAGLLPNSRGQLLGWVANPQAFKPGTKMPRTDLTGDQLTAIVAYLDTLH